MKLKRFVQFSTIAASLLLLSACGDPLYSMAHNQNQNQSQTTQPANQNQTANQTSSTDNSLDTAGSGISLQTPPSDVATTDPTLSSLTYSAAAYPENVKVLNNNQPQFSADTNDWINAQIMNTPQLRQTMIKSNNYIGYNQLDKLGRTGAVIGIINEKLVQSRSSKVQKRPAFPATTRPSGLYAANGRSQNKIAQLSGYRGYLYNKSHLLAYSLGGSMATSNVITGTRAQNVGTNSSSNPGGMADPETQTRNYLAAHPNDAVIYQAIPIYVGQELVPRGVHVQAQSAVDPNGLKINVYVFNNQPGVTLNYATGAWHQN